MLEWMKVEEVAQRVRVGKRAIYKEIEAGQLECKKIGRSIRVSSEHLQAWLEKNDEKEALNNAGEK